MIDSISFQHRRSIQSSNNLLAQKLLKMFKELFVIVFVVSVCAAAPMPCSPAIACVGPSIKPNYGSVGLGGQGGQFPGIGGQNVPPYNKHPEKEEYGGVGMGFIGYGTGR